MDKINNSGLNTSIKVDNKNNDKPTKNQGYLLNKPIEDTLSFGEKNADKPKKNTTLKWVLGIAAAGLGAVLAFKFHKNARAKDAMESNQLETTLNEAKEESKKLDAKLKKRHEENEEYLNKLRKDTIKSKENAKKAEENARKAEEEAKIIEKISQKQTEEIHEKILKIKEETKKIREDFEAQKEANKKFWEDLNNSWKKSEEESKKSWEKFWEDMNNNWKNFNFKGDIPKTAMKNKAQSAVEVFKNFGKGADGEVFNEIKSLGEVEKITEESLKKAHWKMFKKYGPMMNAGTEKEKAEATEIMQKINPACDDIKAYLKSK